MWHSNGEMTTYPFSTIGFLTFVAFVVFATLRRIGADASPYRTLARWHFGFAVVYFAACFAWARLNPDRPFDWGDAILGFYLYFAFQYAFFTHIFATILRGFSIGICVALYQLGGRASFDAVQRGFENGKGMDYIKTERIEVMIESKALIERDGKLAITPFGRFTAILNRVILKVWNLDYLGTNEAKSKR